ncbi:MAG: hypothetical protein K6G63_07965 [Eubacterium sp.]|nr:hypothetical protein [Eubacterium sp.]
MKIAVCIPTYEKRISVVEKILEREKNIINMVDTEFFLYYSGEVTEEIENLKDTYSVNLECMELGMESNIKFFEIYKQMENSDFDYVWIIHDHTYFDEESYLKISDALEKNYDFIVVNSQASMDRISEIATAEELCKGHIWRLNSIGNCIVKRGTFLWGIDWKMMEEKYLTPDSISYSHVGLYFERLSQLHNPRMGLIEISRDRFIDILRNEKYSWYPETVRICAESWVSVIDKIPSCYGKKFDLYKKQDQFFLSKCNLARLRRDGFYNTDIYNKYKKGLELMSPVSLEELSDIATLGFEELKTTCFGDLIDKANKCKSENNSIYIYGAGRHAAETAELIRDFSLDFDGFIVSDKEGNPENLAGKKVMEARKCLDEEGVLILVAVQSSSYDAVLQHINKCSGGRNMIIYNVYK